MHLIPFYAVEPELSADETRTMTFSSPIKDIPPGQYGLFEFYCPDPACNCRRAMLNVIGEEHPDRILAAISYGFDRDGEEAGPYLDPLNPQCEYARTLLWLVEELVLSDAGYVARLERHYERVKQAASDPGHPAYRRLQEILANDARMFPLPGPRRTTKQANRNDPCPCGSGKKYKRCCGRRGPGKHL